MGDRPIRIQDDFETMQRLMNELEYEKKQYENEIEKEMQLVAELDCKTEAAKQEVKLSKESVKLQDEEAKLLNNQCIQNMHNYSSLQEACDILSEQEKNLSRQLKELKSRDETAREKRKTTVDHYEAIYKGYKEKYEKFPLAIQRKQKEGELANWEESYNEAKLRAQETAKKLMWLETTSSQKGATSVNEFPVFKKQKEFIIRLAEMKVTNDELFAELKRKTHFCEELKKTTREEVKAKRQMEEEMRKDELKRIAEERASDERSIAEKRVKAELRRQEERRQHSEEQRRETEERQVEDSRLRKQNQRFPPQVPFQRDEFRPETTSASQQAALQATTAFRQRLPPKIFLPARQMSFQQKQDSEVGVFLAPLPPKDLRRPVTATEKRVRCVETPIAIGTLVPRSEASTTIKTGLIPRQKPLPDALVGTATPVPPKQPPCLVTPVAVTTPLQPKQPSCTETSTEMLPKQVPCPEAGAEIATCLKNLSILGQTDQNVLMETEDEALLPPGSNFSSFPPTDSNSCTRSGFNQHNDVGTAEDQENMMLSSAQIQEHEANQEMRKENYLRVCTETPMATDQEDQLPSLEATATAAGFVYPEISESVSNINSNCRPLQMNNAIGSCCNSEMADDPVSHSSAPNSDCVVTSSITTSVSLPTNISSSPSFSCSLVSEAVANNDCPTLPATFSATYPATMTSSDVHVYCPTSEETAMASQVSDATSVASAVAFDCTTASLSAAESDFCTEESAATAITNSLEQPSGWAICGTKTPVIPVAENADSGKFIGSSSPVLEFNFEKEMAKLKKLSESPALNLYSGRRMFVQSGQSEDKLASVRETGGPTSFMCNFGQAESSRQTKESDKATNPDFGFGNLFTFGNRSDSNEIFSFFGSRGNEAENSSQSGKDRATSSSDDIFKLFGGSDVENTMSGNKEAGGDGSGDIFNMFATSGNVSANSSKNKNDDGGGFFSFGVKPVNDDSVKSQFKFF